MMKPSNIASLHQIAARMADLGKAQDLAPASGAELSVMSAILTEIADEEQSRSTSFRSGCAKGGRARAAAAHGRTAAIFIQAQRYASALRTAQPTISRAELSRRLLQVFGKRLPGAPGLMKRLADWEGAALVPAKADHVESHPPEPKSTTSYEEVRL